MIDVEDVEGLEDAANGRATDDDGEPCEPTSCRRAEAERSLLHALLVDAMRCLFGEVGGPPAKRARFAAEAHAWIASRDDAEPFAFENVCAWLELPAGRLRTYLLSQEGGVDGSAPVDARHGGSRHPAALQVRLRRERNATIQALRAAGERPRDIAERFGLSYDSILLICGNDARNQRDAGDDQRALATG
jgi:hypothetical protein